MSRTAMQDTLVNIADREFCLHKSAGEVTSRSLVTVHCQAGMSLRP